MTASSGSTLKVSPTGILASAALGALIATPTAYVYSGGRVLGWCSTDAEGYLEGLLKSLFICGIFGQLVALP